MPLKVYKWSVNRNEFLLGFRHHLLSWKRDEGKKMMEKSGKLCLFEGKMLPIRSMMRMYCKCQPDVDMLIFFTRIFTEQKVQRSFLGGSFRIWIEARCYPTHLPGKFRFLLMEGEKEACPVNRELEPTFPGCHPDVLHYKWAHLISPSQFHSGK